MGSNRSRRSGLIMTPKEARMARAEGWVVLISLTVARSVRVLA